MGKQIELLLVEDNPGDVLLTVESFKDSEMNINMNVTVDGVEAMDYLHREGEYRTALRPDIILLDLNLPRKNGREVLDEIKNDDNLKSIPVIVLTTSKDEADVLKSYKLHANSFITKPVDLGSFMDVVNSFKAFWLLNAKLPKE